jgi:hypothetical protein
VDKGGSPVNIFVASHESFVSWNIWLFLNFQRIGKYWTMIGPCSHMSYISFPFISNHFHTHKSYRFQDVPSFAPVFPMSRALPWLCLLVAAADPKSWCQVKNDKCTGQRRSFNGSSESSGWDCILWKPLPHLRCFLIS